MESTNQGLRLEAPKIRIDSHGNWYDGDRPLQHQATVALLADHLARDQDGSYAVLYEGRRLPVTVEATPFVVRGLTGGWSEERPVIRLSDGSEEVLDPATLTLQDEVTLLCRVKAGLWPARFDRGAFASLMAAGVLDRDRRTWQILGRCLDVSQILPEGTAP